MLHEDFSYLQLIATVILVVTFVVVMRNFASKSIIFKIFHK